MYVYMYICLYMYSGFVDDVKDKLAGIESELEVFIYNIGCGYVYVYVCIYVCIYMYM
jgi:hypothetical protein